MAGYNLEEESYIQKQLTENEQYYNELNKMGSIDLMYSEGFL